MNIDDQRPTDLRAYKHILEKFQMAISQQRVIRSTPCLVLGWVFWQGRIVLCYFGFAKINDGSWSGDHFEKFKQLCVYV